MTRWKFAQAWRRSYRILTILLCALGAATAAALAGGSTWLDGPLLDLAVKVRAAAFPSEYLAADSPVIVIALDERSLQEPELTPYPRALLAPIWAEVLTSLDHAGVRAVGLDFVFAYSANRFSPDHDRPFLAALNQSRDRVVLARSRATRPATPFLAALRFDPEAIGLADLPADPDGTYRRVFASYPTGDGTTQLGFASALLRRAHIPAIPREILVAPRHHLERMPTYALIDVLRCAKQAPDLLRHVFKEKIVLIGSTLPEEDRKLSAGKYLASAGADAAPLHPCGLHTLGASVPGSLTVPGVFLHAAAIESVAKEQMTSQASPYVVVGLAVLAAVAGAAIGLFLTPWQALVAVVGAGLLLISAAVLLLEHDLWMPTAIPLLGLIVAPLLAYLPRYLVEAKARQRIQEELFFVSGLPGWMIDRLAAGRGEVQEGAQRGEITVMFADLSGFTRLSTQVPPEVLASRCSRYLAQIVQQVETTGGWVNQFLGDAVMALWGVPIAAPDHAVQAVRAALTSAARLNALRQEDDRRGEASFDVKIAVNSGPAVAGRLGTPYRGTYTAAGETVNLAARLESIPALYGCQVVVGAGTVALLRQQFLLRELDTIRVEGIDKPVRVFEPLAEHPASPEQDALVRRYAEALAHYRAGRFQDAAVIWETLASAEVELQPFKQAGSARENPSARMAQRARDLERTPPSTWDGVWVVSHK